MPQTKQTELKENNFLTDGNNLEIYDSNRVVDEAPDPDNEEVNMFRGMNYDEIDFPELNYEVYSPKVKNLPDSSSKLSHSSSLKILEFGKCGNKDLYEEIMMKLLVVRENVSKRTSKSPDDIIRVLGC